MVGQTAQQQAAQREELENTLQGYIERLDRVIEDNGQKY